MGFFVWGFLSLFAFVAAHALVARTRTEESSAHRIVSVLLVAPALQLFTVLISGWFHFLRTVPLAIFAFALFSGCVWLGVRRLGLRPWLGVMQRDLLAPWRILTSAWKEKEPLIFAVPIALYVFGVATLMVLYLRSWMFDPIWYHVTITDYAIQMGSLEWITTHNHYVAGYPRNVELMAVWDCIFQMDNRFDDGPQLRFALLGMAAIAAWGRRLGLSRALSLSAAGVWYALPPVFLLAPSSYVDLATGGMFLAAAYFTFGKGTFDRVLAFAAFGLYVGSKYTGMFHFALFAPILLVRFVLELLRSNARWKLVLGAAAGCATFAVLGTYKYIQNYLHEGNPVYPYVMKMPFGITFPGPESVAGIYGIHVAPGESLYFFGTKGAFLEFVQRWLMNHVHYTPEVHDGGFGPTFWWFLLPSLFIALGFGLCTRRGRGLLPLVLVFVCAVGVPAASWPRYSIAGPGALALAFAWILSHMRSRVLRRLIAVACVGLTFSMAKEAMSGWIEVFPDHWKEAVRATPDERASMALGAHWAYRDGLSREFELRAGDTVTYDDSASFLANYFCRDFRTRVLYLSSEDSQTYVARLQKEHVVWAGVRQGTPSEVALMRAGATKLFLAPGTGSVIYRVPPAP